ncbi:MAG: hypothetical protein J1D87_04910 [Lachnospiraceae bacterium]|nr:hypothetical protein [Lachnospiraceae bacterium]
MNNAEIIKNALDDFETIQEYMLLAKTENAVKTYERMKKKYNSLKTLLNVLGINLTDIDKIKE